MTTGPRSVNDGRLLVGVKATPSGWPTASLDPGSGGSPEHGTERGGSTNHKSWSSRIQGIARGGLCKSLTKHEDGLTGS